MRDGVVAVQLQPQLGAETPQAQGLMVQMSFGSTHMPGIVSSFSNLHPGSGTSARLISPLTLSCLMTCETTSLLPVSSPRYASSSKPSLLQ